MSSVVHSSEAGCVFRVELRADAALPTPADFDLLDASYITVVLTIARDLEPSADVDRTVGFFLWGVRMLAADKCASLVEVEVDYGAARMQRVLLGRDGALLLPFHAEMCVRIRGDNASALAAHLPPFSDEQDVTIEETAAHPPADAVAAALVELTTYHADAVFTWVCAHPLAATEAATAEFVAGIVGNSCYDAPVISVVHDTLANNRARIPSLTFAGRAADAAAKLFAAMRIDPEPTRTRP